MFHLNYLLKIKISFLEILPKSPWEESLADKKNDGVPTDDKVDAILLAINPLFPTPHRITFDWHFIICCTAKLNESLITFFSLLML